MKAIYVQEGCAVDYLAPGDLASGDVVVQGDLVGVAVLGLQAGTLGSLVVEGIFDFPKAAGAGTAIPAGVRLFWDAAESVAKTDDEAGANKFIGKAVKAATDDDQTVRIRLNQ